MNVKIWDDKYLIKSDKYQYSLYKKPDSEDAEEDRDNPYSVTVGHYPTIKFLFEDLAATEGRLNKCTTLNGYVKHIEKVNNKLYEVLEAFQKLTDGKEILGTALDKLEEEPKKTTRKKKES